MLWHKTCPDTLALVFGPAEEGTVFDLVLVREMSVLRDIILKHIVGGKPVFFVLGHDVSSLVSDEMLFLACCVKEHVCEDPGTAFALYGIVEMSIDLQRLAEFPNRDTA